MLLTDKYADKIYGIITCYDRMIIQGYIPNWSHADAMTTYMKLNGIRIFDYPGFSQPLTEQVRQNAEKIAQENGIEIEFIRKLHAFRKDDRIQKIIAETGKTEGLVHIFSAMECCNTYKPWHDKTTGKTFLKFDQSKCLHYYFYFIDRELGLCYLRVPTWPPFRLQFYMNGHNLLAHKLDKKQIAYRMQDNAFLEISDIETAQKLSDRINPEGLHKVLDVFARRYSRHFLNKPLGGSMQFPKLVGVVHTGKNHEMLDMAVMRSDSKNTWYSNYFIELFNDPWIAKNSSLFNDFIRRLFDAMTEVGLLNKEEQGGGNYAINPEHIWVSKNVKHIQCDLCQSRLCVAAEDECAEGTHCLDYKCKGTYSEETKPELVKKRSRS